MTEKRRLTLKFHRSGLFNGRDIKASGFEDEQGKFSWHVATWMQRGDPEEYWVKGEEFREGRFRPTILADGTAVVDIVSDSQVVDVEKEKRDTILKALAKWEKEEQKQA